MGRHITACLVVVAALALPGAPAHAATKPGKYLWATINICDTLRHPDQMGVRASMPGNGRRQNMFMRFHAQYQDPVKKTYADVAGTGVSRWIYAGSARFRDRQAGFTFAFDPPAAGSSFTLRGAVEFQWRARRRTKGGKLRTVVVRRERLVTRAKRKGVRGSDPRGFSAASCLIQ